MDPIRSGLTSGVGATVVLAAFLAVADSFLRAGELFVFSTVTPLCTIPSEGYCTLGTPMADAITWLSFALLFVLAWPLFFVAITWALPGESGVAHGIVYGIALWAGYVVIVFLEIQWGGAAVRETLPMVAVVLLAYVVYGVVLGGGYDYLAEHRTLFGEEGTG